MERATGTKSLFWAKVEWHIMSVWLQLPKNNRNLERSTCRVQLTGACIDAPPCQGRTPVHALLACRTRQSDSKPTQWLSHHIPGMQTIHCCRQFQSA